MFLWATVTAMHSIGLLLQILIALTWDCKGAKCITLKKNKSLDRLEGVKGGP